MSQKKQSKVKTVGIVREVEAIDFTPIYYIRLVKGVRAGQQLRWDKAEKIITLVENKNNLL